VFNSVVDLLKSLLNAGDRSINDNRRKSFLYRSEGKVNADSFLMHRQ
jgi:hypothetical protein